MHTLHCTATRRTRTFSKSSSTAAGSLALCAHRKSTGTHKHTQPLDYRCVLWRTHKRSTALRQPQRASTPKPAQRRRWRGPRGCRQPQAWGIRATGAANTVHTTRTNARACRVYTRGAADSGVEYPTAGLRHPPSLAPSVGPHNGNTRQGRSVEYPHAAERVHCTRCLPRDCCCKGALQPARGSRPRAPHARHPKHHHRTRLGVAANHLSGEI
jgi:hypothetical protein